LAWEEGIGTSAGHIQTSSGRRAAASDSPPPARQPARIDSPPKQATTIEIGRIEIGDLEFT